MIYNCLASETTLMIKGYSYWTVLEKNWPMATGGCRDVVRAWSRTDGITGRDAQARITAVF
jgi:hypothetical protein